MSLTYSSYVASLVNLMPVDSSANTAFQTVLPNIIDDAEQRIYGELDLLNTVVRDATAALTPGGPGFNLPSSIGTFVVVNEINIVTPAGQTNPSLGTRNPVAPASLDVILGLFPSSAGSSVPQYFGMVTQTNVFFAPWPDQAYQAEVIGTVRPAPLSATNATTLLSVYFPQLLIAASMVFASGYMKNFGASSDNPQMAQSWEAHYQLLKASAETEEARKKFTQAGWSSRQPAPQATPPRT